MILLVKCFLSTKEYHLGIENFDFRELIKIVNKHCRRIAPQIESFNGETILEKLNRNAQNMIMQNF